MVDVAALLARESDSRASEGEDFDAVENLAVQVLAMHDREHAGRADFCDRACCRQAFRERP